MRQVVLDTETTGIDWKKGNRVVEIGCVELLDRRPSGRTFHRYLNPDREFEQGAQEVTGLTLEFLADKPRFAEVAQEFLAFIDGAELIIHNAVFDIGFLDSELARVEGGTVRERCGVEDTLLLARKRFPGAKVSLDALCKRLGVDNSQRQLHGALLDAQILTDVYLALTSEQCEMGFDAASSVETRSVQVQVNIADAALRPRVRVAEEDAKAHAERLDIVQKKAGRCVWRELEEQEGAA